MKKILAIIGSSRKGNTYKAVQEIENYFAQRNDIEFEYMFLNKYDLKLCDGCKLCFDKGEELCPLKDDRDAVIAKLKEADGVIMASPNYTFHVSARIKNLLDRIGFYYHRPYFFGKVFMPVVSYAIFGGRKVSKYIKSSGENLGFDGVGGAVVKTLEPMTDKSIIAMKKEMLSAAKRFEKAIDKQGLKKPGILRQMMFNMTRSGIQHAHVKLKDYYYFKQQGWFESDYYYDVKLGFFRRILARLFDSMGKAIVR